MTINNFKNNNKILIIEVFVILPMKQNIDTKKKFLLVGFSKRLQPSYNIECGRYNKVEKNSASKGKYL